MSIDYPSSSGPLGRPGSTTKHWHFWLIWCALVAVLFYRLGGAALFEPDEGRNTEKAREILVLNDWLTPHENFHAVLDKPIAFYWLIATSLKVFGLSEWAARLPSALAAFACLVLVYRFTQEHWGRWEAFWSVLILLTSSEFFILARTVIFDMSLTLFVTLAMWAFYQAVHCDHTKQRRLWCLLLYGALAVATLIKGLIGIAIPGMVFFFYLLLCNRWAVLRRIYIIPGVLLFVAVVLPWYLAADARNSGYLRYFLWDEHFRRFATAEFDRSKPWYYFIVVLLIGFFPWTPLLPLTIKEAWQSRFDERTRYLVLWIALPLLFFSASKSKLPHYILPIFPALGILTGTALVRCSRAPVPKLRFALSLTWWMQATIGFYLVLGTIAPRILARQIRNSVEAMEPVVWIYAAISTVALVYLIATRHSDAPRSRRSLYLIQGLGLCGFIVFIAEMMISVSPVRSAKYIAAKARAYVATARQVVFYDTYLSGMAFYLRTKQPIWLITNGNKKRTFLGHYYALSNRPDPVTPWGQALFDFDEFRDRWRHTDQPLLIIVKEKNLSRLQENVGQELRRLAALDEYLVVERP